MLIRSRRLLGRMAIVVAAALMLSIPLTPVHADSTDWADRLGKDLRAARAENSGEGVMIAVLSSGVDSGVGALRGQVVQGKDFVGSGNPPKILGTLLSSLMIGGSLKGFGPAMTGLVPRSKILAVRVHPDIEEPIEKNWWESKRAARALARGIRYSADKGAHVIMVLQSVGYDSSVEVSSAVAYAHAKNSVIVAPALEKSLPAASPGVIGVGALKLNGRHDRKSSGTSTTAIVAAPAMKLPAIGPGGRAWQIWGASVATSFITSTVAKIRSEYPELTPVQVRTALIKSARHPKGAGRYDTGVGFGVMNPAGALKEAAKLAGSGPPVYAARSGVVPDDRNFAEPVTVNAVRHPPALMLGLGALVLAGAAALIGWLVLLLRGRRRRTAAVDEHGAEPAPGSQRVDVPQQASASVPPNGDAEPVGSTEPK